MLVATTLFVVAAPAFGFTQGQGGTSHRVPVPIEPPSGPPACPTMTVDADCTRTGTASASTYAMAASLAELACDPQLEKCRMFQKKESAQNKAACEAVAGCVFGTPTLKQHSCYANPAPGGDCNDDTDDQGHMTSATCVADGQYNITGYTCTRPTTGGGTGGTGGGTGGTGGTGGSTGGAGGSGGSTGGTTGGH